MASKLTGHVSSRNQDGVLHTGAHTILRSISRYSLLAIVLATVLSFSFVPFHVLAEVHTHAHLDATHGNETEHTDGGHVPHPETDHTTQCRIVAKVKLQPVVLATILIAASDAFVEPESSLERVAFQKELPPDDSPPVRFSPRGPPVA